MSRVDLPRPGDIFVAGVSALLAALYTAIALTEAGGAVWVQAVLSWAITAALLFWRSRVSAVAVVILALLGFWSLNWMTALPENLGVSPWLVTAPMIVWSTARHIPGQRWWGRGTLTATLAGAIVSPAMWQVTLAGPVYRSGADWLVFLALHWLVLVCAYLVAVGQLSRELARQQRIGAAVRERELKIHAAREEERILIAGEVHDVLAHSLTLIKVTANIGLKLGERDPAVMAEQLRQIHDTSTEGLAQVRGIVTALRDDAQAPGPAPQLTALPDTFAEFKRAGLNVSVTPPGDLRQPGATLSALTQLAVVRIITEGLTNALRHQGAGTTVQVKLNIDESVKVEVRSTAEHVDVTDSGGGTGTGLLGLAERARALGGQLEASGDRNDFRIHATLPKVSDDAR